jgi:hypothetical protein
MTTQQLFQCAQGQSKCVIVALQPIQRTLEDLFVPAPGE